MKFYDHVLNFRAYFNLLFDKHIFNLYSLQLTLKTVCCSVCMVGFSMEVEFINLPRSTLIYQFISAGNVFIENYLSCILQLIHWTFEILVSRWNAIHVKIALQGANLVDLGGQTAIRANRLTTVVSTGYYW